MTRSPLFLMSLGIALASCQPGEPDRPPPPQVANLNYDLLGIWPQRYQAYDIAQALKQEGIQSTLSGHAPCALNVEADKWREAWDVLYSNPHMLDQAIKLNRDPNRL